MNRNLMRLEFLLNRRGFIISAVVVLSFQLMLAAFAETFIQDPTLIKLKFEALPPALMEGFGINLDLMTSYEGWMAGQPQTYYILLLGIYAAIWASSSIAKERDQQTKEFIFSLPYSRSEILFSRAAVHGIQLTVIFLLNSLLTVAAGYWFSEVNSILALLQLSLAGYLVSLALAGLGYILTVFLQTERAALTIGIALVVIMFLLNMLASLGEPLSYLAELSLFKLFSPEDIVLKHLLNSAGILVTLGIYAAGLWISRTVLVRQDL